MSIGHLPPGTRGFDVNAILGEAEARAFHAAGYRFAIRYVRRTVRHPFDASAGEIAAIRSAGLAVMLVQHVAPAGWLPSAMLGTQYGAVAAREAERVGLPPGVSLWCDLEGVSGLAHMTEVVAYCNAWHDAVDAAGFAPGLYVGDASGLTAGELYHRLKFRAYWGAYNLDVDAEPAVRGLQMRQRIRSMVVPGVDTDFDDDVIVADASGDTPVLLLP